jgi:hypothetical protein
MAKASKPKGRKPKGRKPKAVTVRTALAALKGIEKWLKAVRAALATIDQNQPLAVKPSKGGSRRPPPISGGNCPPPE